MEKYPKNEKIIRFSKTILIILLIGLSQQLSAQTKTLKVAGLQMNVTTDIEQNKRTIIKALEEAAQEGAELLVTPEGSLSGYNNHFDQKKLDTALEEVENAVKQFGIGLFLGTCIFEGEEEQEAICYNQVRAYSAEGDFLGEQSKILLCSPIDRPGTGEMHDYGQGHLNLISWGEVKIGILICNDLWATPGYTTIANPYLPMELARSGADVIFHSINSGPNQRYRKFHEGSAELWAFSTKLPILEVNAAKGDKMINAQSGLIEATGERSVLVPLSGEQLFFCDIEIKDH